jgi:hypothetical protein
MKKILGLVLLCSAISFGQNINQYGVALNYGTEKTLGIDVIYVNKYVWGVGMSFGLKSYGTGDDYTDSLYTNSFSDQLLVNSDTDKKNLSIYGITGYKYKKIKITGKLGYGTKTTYKNYYDPDRIFGDNGYYYKTIQAGGSILIGSSVGLELSKKLYIDGGYDTFNGGIFGLTYIF